MRSRRRGHHHDREHLLLLQRLSVVMLIRVRLDRNSVRMVYVAIGEHTGACAVVVVLHTVALHTVALLMGIHLVIRLVIYRIAVQLIVRQLKSQHNTDIRRELVGSLAK